MYPTPVPNWDVNSPRRGESQRLGERAPETRLDSREESQDALAKMAERVGFEPTVRLPVRRISSAVLSTTQPPLRFEVRAGWNSGGSVGAAL